MLDRENLLVRRDRLVKVLFVCTGNICRSPTAEGILRVRAQQTGLADWVKVDSAGTHGYHAGEPPDPRSVATAMRHQVDIQDLRARQVTGADFLECDVIAAMENTHRQQLLRICPPELASRVTLLMSFSGARPVPEVPDPYYGDDGFEAVFRMIEHGIAGLLDHLRRVHLDALPAQRNER